MERSFETEEKIQELFKDVANADGQTKIRILKSIQDILKKSNQDEFFGKN